MVYFFDIFCLFFGVKNGIQKHGLTVNHKPADFWNRSLWRTPPMRQLAVLGPWFWRPGEGYIDWVEDHNRMIHYNGFKDDTMNIFEI